MSETLQTRILQRLDEDSERPALAFVDGRGAFTWLSRAEFFARARRAASLLAASGLEAGGVAVVVSVDPEVCATAVLGTLTLGAVPLLVAPPAIQGVNSSLGEVVADVVRRTGARVCLAPRDLGPRAEELRAASPGMHLELGGERLLEAARRDDTPVAPLVIRDAIDVAAMQLTSGTTRFPRIAVWEQERVLAALDGMARGMDVRDEDVYVNWTPLYHDMGLVNNFLLCLVRGLPLALLSPLDVVRRPALWLRALHDTGATTTWSPNFGFALAAQRVADGELEGVRLDGVRGFWNAAERVHLSTFERFHRRFAPHGVQWEALKANFGCVETIGGVTFTAPDGALAAECVDGPALRATGHARAARPEDERAQWFVGCGRAYPGAEPGVFGPDGAALPEGEVGEVAFRGPARLTEYLDQPDETAGVLRGDWVLTGDLGYLRAGELFWTGRLLERIHLQGKKLDPSELEPALLAVEGLRKGCFCAFGREDPERGTEVLVVLAEVEPGAADRGPELARRVRAEVATRVGVAIEELALVPKGSLTKTSSGKRRHRHFRELFEAGALDVLHRSAAGRVG